jgi:hypothetical protein
MDLPSSNIIFGRQEWVEMMDVNQRKTQDLSNIYHEKIYLSIGRHCDKGRECPKSVAACKIPAQKYILITT